MSNPQLWITTKIKIGKLFQKNININVDLLGFRVSLQILPVMILNEVTIKYSNFVNIFVIFSILNKSKSWIILIVKNLINEKLE
jgi:hypothetical protein